MQELALKQEASQDVAKASYEKLQHSELLSKTMLNIQAMLQQLQVGYYSMLGQVNLSPHLVLSTIRNF